MWIVSRDLPTSRKEPLKSADDSGGTETTRNALPEIDPATPHYSPRVNCAVAQISVSAQKSRLPPAGSLPLTSLLVAINIRLLCSQSAARGSCSNLLRSITRLLSYWGRCGVVKKVEHSLIGNMTLGVGGSPRSAQVARFFFWGKPSFYKLRLGSQLSAKWLPWNKRIQIVAVTFDDYMFYTYTTGT